MIEMTLEIAERAARAAQVKAREMGAPMTVSVVDEGGRLVLCARADGTGFLTPETSRAKAVAAAAFRKPTSALAEQRVAHPAFWETMPTIVRGEALPSPGGTPIVRGGRVIGGIGCGGGTGEQDQVCSDAGAKAVADAKAA